MTALSPLEHARLVKVLGLLGSAHAGERAAAGLKAHNLLAERGLVWRDVVRPATAASADPDNPKAARRAMYPERSGPPEPVELLSEHQREAWLLLASGFPWDDWKRTFLGSIRARRESLTHSQKEKLRECRRMTTAWRAERERAA